MGSRYGEQLKLFGMEQALAAAPDWAAQARVVIRVLAMSGQPFTSEDLVEAIGLPRGHVGQHRNNAVGAAFSAAARKGEITRIGYAKADRHTLHAAVISVWIGAHP